MLTDTEIHLIMATRSLFSQKAERVAVAFYTHLFMSNPELRPFFPDDILQQGRKLSATIVVAIDGLRDWERMSGNLEVLARRHLAYGVQREHYGSVGAALIATLRESGADHATTTAWTKAFRLISAHMCQCAYGETVTSAEGPVKRTFLVSGQGAD